MNIVEWFVLALVPVGLGGARYLWRLHRRYVAAHPEEKGLTLSWVLAMVGSIGSIVGSFFGVVVVLRRSGHEDIADALGGLVVIAIIVLELLPIGIAAFLRFIDSRRIIEDMEGSG